MGASRQTREEVLERQVLAATVAFGVTFVGCTYALVPYAIELPAAFSRADAGIFPFTPQHVSIGASRGRGLWGVLLRWQHMWVHAAPRVPHALCDSHRLDAPPCLARRCARFAPAGRSRAGGTPAGNRT